MSTSEQIAVERFGSGPAVLFVHGEAGPEQTWEQQMELADRWSLIVPTRRPGHDLEADAEDVDRLLTKRTHLVGFAYGGLVAALAATRNPGSVRTLTLVDAPAEITNAPDLELDALARAGIPVMVVSGGRDDQTESTSDAVANRLRARREIVQGEGEEELVPRTPGFNEVLEDFLRGSAGTARFRTA